MKSSCQNHSRAPWSLGKSPRYPLAMHRQCPNINLSFLTRLQKNIGKYADFMNGTCWSVEPCSSVITREKLNIFLWNSVFGVLLKYFGTFWFNPLNPELNPICYLLALLGAHHFLHVNRIMVKLLTLRRLMSYIYGAPILDVSRSHTTTQHSR